MHSTRSARTWTDSRARAASGFLYPQLQGKTAVKLNGFLYSPVLASVSGGRSKEAKAAEN